MSIITKAGDQGQTTLLFNRSVPKTDLRVEACGTVDELNAALGLAKAAGKEPFLHDLIESIQNDLFLLMGELATLPGDSEKFSQAGFRSVSPAMTARLETVAADLESQNFVQKGWATPGAALCPAALDLARTVCRRAERRACSLQSSGPSFNREIIIYLNRLSDLLWLLARWAERPH